MTLFIISILAFTTTILGGLFALKFTDKLHLTLGFSAGAIIGVAFFDLIPEAIELGQRFEPSTLLSFTTLGFITYMILERFVIAHHHDHEYEAHTECKRGLLGASSLSLHSFLDGIAVGIAFHVSTSVGVIVAIAVLAHDFSDGINTVNMIIKNHGKKADALKWLMVDALAPVLGICSTLFFTLPEDALSIILSIFAGFFLYIGASDLLPESHHKHPTIWTTVATIIGIVTLFVVIKIASI